MLWDVEGRRYIDFAGGIAVLNTGHTRPEIVDAIKEQLDLFSHTCFQVLAYEGYVELLTEPRPTGWLRFNVAFSHDERLYRFLDEQIGLQAQGAAA